MIIADALSRLPNPDKKEDIPLDVGIGEIQSLANIHIDLVNFGVKKQSEIQQETARDTILQALAEIIKEGWPDNIKEVPKDLRCFWSYREELGMAHAIIFKGKQVLIPETLREDILTQLHEGHMGIERTRRLAR